MSVVCERAEDVVVHLAVPTLKDEAVAAKDRIVARAKMDREDWLIVGEYLYSVRYVFNPDGSLMLDASGEPIATSNQDYGIKVKEGGFDVFDRCTLSDAIWVYQNKTRCNAVLLPVAHPQRLKAATLAYEQHLVDLEAQAKDEAEKAEAALIAQVPVKDALTYSAADEKTRKRLEKKHADKGPDVLKKAADKAAEREAARLRAEAAEREEAKKTAVYDVADKIDAAGTAKRLGGVLIHALRGEGHERSVAEAFLQSGANKYDTDVEIFVDAIKLVTDYSEETGTIFGSTPRSATVEASEIEEELNPEIFEDFRTVVRTKISTMSRVELEDWIVAHLHWR